MFRSLRWRLQAWHAFILLVVVGAFGTTLYLQLRKARMDEIDAELLAAARVLEGSLRLYPRQVFESGLSILPGRGSVPPGRPAPPTRQRFERTLRLPTYFVERYSEGNTGPYFIVWLENGSVLKADPAPIKSPYQAPPWLASDLAEPRYRTLGDNREAVVVGPERSQILVGRPVLRELSSLNALALRVATSGLAVIAAGLLGGWWLSRKAVRPIQTMGATAASITASNLSWRINLRSVDDELGVLGEILNSMFARLERSFEQQVRFTADASHELRTPLAVILHQTELALSRPREAAEYRKALEACKRSADRMKSLIQDLLILARADAGRLELRREPVDLQQLAEECAALLRPIALQHHVGIAVEGGPAEAMGDPDRLAQVVNNLLGNAIIYNRPGGSVKVSTSSSGAETVLEVSDTGVGIPPGHLTRLFERFYRVDAARSRSSGGSGLGLAICKSIIDAHGGSIDVDSKPGAGSKFTVRLPHE